MNLNSRFAGVSRAARSLIGSSSADALAAAEQPVPAAAATEPAPAGDPSVEPDPTEKPQPDPEPAAEPEPDGNDVGPSGAAALEGEAKGRADERARMSAVFASEHSQGRERQAARMLQTSMSADEITGLLAETPKGAAAADPMLSRLAAQPNPDLGAGASADKATDAKAADAGWDRAWAANPARRAR